MARQHFAGCALAPFGEAPVTAKYDLLIIAGGDADGIGGVIEYAADLFAAADVATLARQLAAILAQVTSEGGDVMLMDLHLGAAAPSAASAPASLAIELQF